MTAGVIATSERRMVLGLGASGRSVVRYWQSQGVPFSVADTRPALANDLNLRADVQSASEQWFGEVPVEALARVSELVVSPGIALDHPLVVHAKAAGARVLGDVDLFMRDAKAPVVGITGSNGKSTVTAMFGAMAAACGRRVAVGGNLGTPALDLLDSEVELYVLELSSFQLERSESLNLSVATVLNLSPDHLDRHGSMPLYHQAKHAIFRGARSIVVNRADALTIPLLEQSVPITVWRPDEPDLQEFGVRTVEGRAWLCRGFDTLMPIAELPLVGRHNVNNALAALALGAAAGLPLDGLLQGLRDFRGLPHRCELVTERDQVRWINDSKGTNVGATVAALEGLEGHNNVVLIAGGVGKGQDFNTLVSACDRHCKRVLTLGESARDIELALGNTVPVQRVADLPSAVERARELAEPGDVVLLSPACASFDQFRDYQERGDVFRDAVLEQLGGRV